MATRRARDRARGARAGVSDPPATANLHPGPDRVPVYEVVDKSSKILGRIVYRCPGWPRGRNGNMLVALPAAHDSRLYVVRWRALRRFG